MSTIEADAQTHTPHEPDSHDSFEADVAKTQAYLDSPRFEGITRLYSARQVVEQRGTIPSDYIVAREAAEAFYPRLRELFAQRKSITTFGPYSPGLSSPLGPESERLAVNWRAANLSARACRQAASSSALMGPRAATPFNSP